MKLLEKVTKMKELKSELYKLKKSFDSEMLDYLVQEFRSRGFVSDPRGYMYEGSLYDPNTKVSIHIGHIGVSSIGISVIDMVNDGMNWGSAYHKIPGGTQIKFNYLKDDFEKFFNTTFKNRVKKLNEYLAV